MAGSISAPATPWWQRPNQQPTVPAPGGYSYDAVKGDYAPTVGSPADQLTQRNRSQGFEDQNESANMDIKRLGIDQMRKSMAAPNETPDGMGKYYRGDLYNKFTQALAGLGDDPGASLSISSSGSGSGGVGMPSVAPVSYGGPGLEAARSATFARTKDNAAHTAQAAMTGLGDELSRRGLGGGGYEAGQIGQNLSREANTIGEGDRMQAENELGHQQHAADESYQGGIAQRGQDIGAAESAANRKQQFQLAAAGLANQKKLAMTSMLTSALSGLARPY